MEDERRYCTLCHAELSEDENYEVDGEPLCEECMEEHTTTCDHCGETIWSNDSVYDGRTTLCSCCFDDEGISGCSTKRREGFQAMVADALAGKIDLIITKSVSRFARNTVDSLTTIRSLKEHNVECYFEKENIWTFDGKG